MLKNKFLISHDNEDIVQVISSNGCEIWCDKEPMKEIVPNSTNAAEEKHVPKVTVTGNTVKVDVGSVKHPMEDAHSIRWVYIVTNEGCQRKELKCGTDPVVEFALCNNEKLQEVYAYCNLHGLWKINA